MGGASRAPAPILAFPRCAGEGTLKVTMVLVTADEMRTLDRLTIELGTPGHVLMERAGRGATQVLLECFPRLRRKGRRAVIVFGKGNNGGDGLVIARLLRQRGVRTDVVVLGRAADL